ncbi:MAG TPA: pyridoxal phosphate-dependent aminotransferase [Candidatus Altiarchaeales archaeon]|nr:pyridoxal phosphate-dependent aminotransferase [Candidatus Altiarchaeales archaeon]
MVSKRVSGIPFSGIRKFFELVQKSKDVVSLGVGEPDFPTPEPLKYAGIRAIENDYTSYTSNYGILELRREIANKLKKENRINADPQSEILITVGVSEALDIAIRSILDPNDEVLVPEPCYVSYKANVWFAYGFPVEVPSTEENEFRPLAEDIEKRISKRTKAIIISTPCNPTGAILRRKNLEEIADIAIEHDLIVLSDELYEELIYDDEKHYSIGSFNGMGNRTITLNGFSKAYAFTGWRLGYVTANSDIIENMMKIHQYTILCAPSIAQYAALEAFKHRRYVRDMVEQYDHRRRLLVKGLNSIDGISCIMPKGAFYTFPNIKETGLKSEEFAEKLLKEGKVAVVPGNTFGDCGEGYVRCSYSVSREDISEALGRIEKFMENIG